jgi:type III secretion system FlhB-like substrate exporter
LKEPKLVQLGKVLYKWFTALRYKGKPMTAPIIIAKGKSFYGEMKITDKFTFSEDSNKKLAVRRKVSIFTV